MIRSVGMRLLLAAAAVTAAVVVAVIGWYNLAGEPQLNRQIPYLASAGMAVLILSAVGGALIVADRLDTRDRRVLDLEAALRRLAHAVAPLIEAPPRGAVTRRLEEGPSIDEEVKAALGAGGEDARAVPAGNVKRSSGDGGDGARAGARRIARTTGRPAR